VARRTRPGSALAIAAIALLPLREPLLVVGRVGLGEWSAAGEAASAVQVRRVGREVFLLVRTDGLHPVHVFIEEAGTLRLLHASSALGEARYQRTPEGDYRLARGFAWSLADPARGGPPLHELAEAQREHLAREGWVASTAALGERGVVEFRLASALIDRPGVRWGAGYLAGGSGPDSLRHFPPGSGAILVPDDELALLAGLAPARLHRQTPASPAADGAPGGSSASGPVRAHDGSPAGSRTPHMT